MLRSRYNAPVEQVLVSGNRHLHPLQICTSLQDLYLLAFTAPGITKYSVKGICPPVLGR